jgi:hypothetical protein
VKRAGEAVTLVPDDAYEVQHEKGFVVYAFRERIQGPCELWFEWSEPPTVPVLVEIPDAPPLPLARVPEAVPGEVRLIVRGE